METRKPEVTFEAHILQLERTLPTHGAAILKLVADPYGYGYRDRVLVGIEGINNRTMIDTYFLKLDGLQPQNGEPESNELREHKQRLQFFQAYYLLAYGYYTELELKGHPGVLQIVKDLRDKGELKEGEDIEYAGAGGAGRDRGYSGTSMVRKEKTKKGLLKRLLGVL